MDSISPVVGSKNRDSTAWPTRVSVSLCDPRTFHALCEIQQNYKPLLRVARSEDRQPNDKKKIA